MNRLQRTIIWIAILAAIAMYIFPPVGTIETYGRSTPQGYAFQFGDMDGQIIDYWRLMIQYLILAAISTLLVLSYRGAATDQPISRRTKLIAFGLLALAAVGSGATWLVIRQLEVNARAEADREYEARRKQEEADASVQAKLREEEKDRLREPRELGEWGFGKNVKVGCETRYIDGVAHFKVIVKTRARLIALVGDYAPTIEGIFKDTEGFRVLDVDFPTTSHSTIWISGQDCLQMDGRELMSEADYERISTWTPSLK